MEQGCSEKHSKASLAIMVPNFLISNPWRSRYSIRPTEPNFITLIHFHHLNEEATRMQTVSSGAFTQENNFRYAYSKRYQQYGRMDEPLSTSYLQRAICTHKGTHRKPSFYQICRLIKRKNSYCRIWSCNSATYDETVTSTISSTGMRVPVSRIRSFSWGRSFLMRPVISM